MGSGRVRITTFGRKTLVAKRPHIFIAGLISAGGLSLINSSAIADSYKSLQEPFFGELSEASSEGADSIKEESFSYQKSNKHFDENLVASPSELQLRANRQRYDARQKRFIAEGKVSVSLDGALLKADRIEFDRGFQTLYAVGSVRFKKGAQYFQATSFRYNLIQRRGYLKDVYGILDLKSLDKDLKIISKKNKQDNLKIIESRSQQKPRFLTEKNNQLLDSASLKLRPLNSWVHSDDGFSLFETKNERSIDSDLIACPPSIPPNPDMKTYSWSVTTWGGQMTASDFGEAFIFDDSLRDEYLFGIGLNKNIYQNGPLSFELEADWFKHSANKQTGGQYQDAPYSETPAQTFSEGILGIGARIWLRPWLNLGIVEGISYNTSPSNYERTYRSKQSQILNYLGFEMEALVSERVSLVGRIHHRSGAFGTFGGVKGGSNSYLIGFRYRWDQQNKQKESVVFSPPKGCLGAKQRMRSLPTSIDDSLDIQSVRKLPPFPKKKLINSFKTTKQSQQDSDLLKTNSSNLSFAEQEKIRIKAIASIDQRINDLKYRDSFALQGKFGLERDSRGVEEKNQPGSIQISQLQPKVSSKIVTGSITRWRIQAAKIIINPDGWKANRMNFTNDPFTPTQTRIDAYNVLAKENKNGDLLVTSSRSRLIFEEKISIPFVKSTRVRRTERIENRWVIGIDQRDRDGVFIGRQFQPIELGEKFTISFQPQFLIQRAVKNETNSYIKPGSSLTSEKVTSPVITSDLFGLKSKLRGKALDFNVSLDSNISTFNPDHFLNGSRYWLALDKFIQAPLFGSLKTTLFGAYRYRVWNGSMGENHIYTAYGGYADKKYDFNLGGLSNAYIVRFGVGNYQAETLSGGSMSELWRLNVYSELKSKYILWQGNPSDMTPYFAYRYSPEAIVPGLALESSFSQAYFAYQDGSTQKIITFTGGPSLTLGTFSKPFLDYTKFSIYSGGSLKEGSSPFSFDEVVDLATLGIGLTQQVFGPLVLNTGFEFNIDGGSSYYGKAIDSNIELRWQRRSYDIGLFYNPYKGMGGISFHLNDFNFTGTGLPFAPYYSTKEIR